MNIHINNFTLNMATDIADIILMAYLIHTYKSRKKILNYMGLGSQQAHGGLSQAPFPPCFLLTCLAILIIALSLI